MTISQGLLSILAMDAYNRGYGVGRPNVLGIQRQDSSVGEVIGTATIIKDDVLANAQDNGFYAAAYQVNGEIVISFRGTDDGSDAWNDWQFITDEAGAGVFGLPQQAILAAEFYNSVRARFWRRSKDYFDRSFPWWGAAALWRHAKRPVGNPLGARVLRHAMGD